MAKPLYDDRDRALLELVGMTPEQAEREARMAEDESVPDPLTGRVWYGLHLEPNDERMVTVSLRLPKSEADRLSAKARSYHISRSEYMRRRLVDA
ncbi:ribbon-helix-helix protein, CopG family [Bifidobacterium pseudocatenulatum]|jgi:hypothetical protein|uniref:ribbon-helix-helix protein, CopG family n=1 Tax=Bifidobacterium pseudocatenulatum TaxID=28026 RepID=UPI001F0F1A24|nr:ribbon-helix-helix protein, CopG family [Bifidobacterium pseudocatenulatum]MCH4837670.1 ribbon-helix-helix protein, CopG family [Bifidobacterium pseudocatenulatum]